MMKKKYLLREFFTLKLGKEVFEGPCEIELNEEEASQNMHKLEEIQSAQPEKETKKKGKE